MSTSPDTALQDTQQAFRSFAFHDINPVAVSVTGLQIALDPAAGTITADPGHDFTGDGFRAEQKLVLTAGALTGSMKIASVDGNVITGTMDTAMQAIANVVDTTAWTLVVFYEKAWQGVPYDNREGVPYFESAWLPGSATELELGKSPNMYREVGIFQVVVNGEDGGGMEEVLACASYIAGLLRNKFLIYGNSGNIRLRQPSVGKAVAGNGWISIPISVPYRRDAVPPS